METKAREKCIRSIKKKLKFTNCFTVEPRGLSGGLCLFWNDSIDLDVYSWSQNLIATNIDDRKGNKWKCKFIYGSLKFAQRRLLWKEMAENQDSELIPQLFIRDFNDIICQDEKEGLHPKPSSQMVDFRNFIDANYLMDLELKGGQITWLETRPAISSDHCALVLTLEPKKKCPRYFKYEVHWEDHRECKEVVKRGWNRSAREINKWENLIERMESCKKELKSWSRRNFTKADREIAKLQEELQNLQNSSLTEQRQELSQNIKKRIEQLWKQEEKYWGQRSRLKWLKWGDSNTAFFLATTLQRRDINKLERIKDSSGN
ncbi:uncharacterized protein [Arachis hypogaea]|uniref:uncharacterized protein n=1 Tax=Arachis hypogaea TaxID=3818 RepID=UPI003B2257DB